MQSRADSTATKDSLPPPLVRGPVLDLVIPELVHHLRVRLAAAELGLPRAVVERGASLGRAAVRGIRSTGGQASAGGTAGRARSRGLGQHSAGGLRRGPVQALLGVLLHAQPVLVAHGDAAAAPLVVVGALGRVAERLLGLLAKNGEEWKR